MEKIDKQIAKMVMKSQINNLKLPYFLVSSKKIDISKHKLKICANVVDNECTTDSIYLVSYHNLPKENEWWKHNDCKHGFRYRGECGQCHEDERQREIKWEIEDKRIGALLDRMRDEGRNSLRDMLNHDCK